MTAKPNAVALSRKHLTREEREIREQTEARLKGEDLQSTPPRELSADQKKIYKWLYKELKPARILSRLDLPTMKNACIVIDRLAKIDIIIERIMSEEKIDLKMLNQFHKIRTDYFGQFIRITTELCLSPTARAKIGTLAVTSSQETDPLLKALE